MMSNELIYRPCVGIILLNNDKKVFAGCRVDTPDAWQMPQGGIEKGESPKAAALRELQEEVGTKDATIIAEYPGTLKYDLPKKLVGKVLENKYKGQEQRWYLMMLHPNAKINIKTKHPEFNSYQWVNLEELPELIVHFKKDVYEALVKYFAPIIKNL